MNFCTDWNCRLLAGFPDQIGNIETAAKALEMIHERASIARFCFLPEFSLSHTSISAFQIRFDAALNALKSLVTFPAVFFGTASVTLLPHFREQIGLRRLCLPKTDYLPISVPLVFEDWVETELAYLSRRAPYRILLTNAHLLSVFYPNDVIQRLLNLPNLAYQFSFRSLSDPKIASMLRLLLDRDAPVLLGSGVNSLEKAARFDFSFYHEQAEKMFSPYETELLFYGKRIYGKNRQPN